MKRFIPCMLLGAMIWAASPAQAQTGPDYENMRFDITYTPLRVSTTDPEGVCHANMPAITFNGEGKVYRGIVLGGSFTYGSGDAMDVTGVNNVGTLSHIGCTDTTFTDLKAYVKLPFNLTSYSSSNRVRSTEPSLSPFYGYVGYKNTCLTAKSNQVSFDTDKVNLEVSSGVGVGIGAEACWNPVAVYGQVVYYPSMITKNVSVNGDNDGKLRVWECDIGLKTHIEDSPIQGKIGYHFEQHQASNVKLQYDGIQLGIIGEF